MKQKREIFRFITISSLIILCLFVSTTAMEETKKIKWQHLSSTKGRIPKPDVGRQVATLILDIDKDGVNDFVIASYEKIAWFQRTANGWKRYAVENGAKGVRIEAGGDFYDIDGDGDLDILEGAQSRAGEIWWWENPYPNFTADKPWKRHEVIAVGGTHHDQMFGDFDGDGKTELAFWYNGGKQLYLAEIPSNPTQPWPYSLIAQFKDKKPRPEGFARMDIDLDGKLDIVGGGNWFKHIEGKKFEVKVIDNDYRFTRSAAGDLIKGGRPEVVIGSGDGVGPLNLYEYKDRKWLKHTLIEKIDHGHTLQTGDINDDGNLDIYTAEMYRPGAGPNCKQWILYGDGKGYFNIEVLSTAIGTHEGKIGDLDGDGDLDILQKDFQQDRRVDIWLNNGTAKSTLGEWRRHHIDDLPARAMFVLAGDIDGDGHQDLVAGGWWWKNPGSLGASWSRCTLGEPLRNMAALYDFDGDGDLDVLGTEGVGSEGNNTFVWARNDGRGSFTVLKNINYTGGGDFLQGCTVGDFGAGLQVALSWHRGGGGIHALNVPSNPSNTTWTSTLISTTMSSPPQGEDLDHGDIDRDGDLDLLLGDVWLRNDGARWTTFRMGRIKAGDPDRVDLADVNGDGRLDAVIALENGTDVWWFEAPENPTGEWTQHKIGVIAGQGFSMDTADFDGDGDPDVVIGEHRGKQENRVVLFENVNVGAMWKQHVIDKGHKNTVDHHDGTQAVDLDGDGDLDITSIGWYNPKVWIYENK